MLTAIWLFLTGFTGYGQGEMTFDHITVEDGLTQSTVTAIFRDSRDFMWFGTYNGINLYDGVKIRQFESISNDSLSLSISYVKVFYEDRYKNLWVGTGNSLCRYDHVKERFDRILFDTTRSATLQNDFITSITEDDAGRLWVVTTIGIICYTPESGAFRDFPLPDRDSLKDAIIVASHALNADTVYLVADNKIYLFETQNNKYSLVTGKTPSEEITRILVTQNHDIWLGTENNGIFRIKKDNTIDHFFPGDKPSSGLSSISIKSINTDNRKNIWFSTRNGLYRLNNDGKTFTKYQNELGNTKSLLSSYIRTFYEDRQGIIWVGTTGGVNKYDPDRLLFRHFKTTPEQVKSDLKNVYSDDNIIWCFAKDKRNNLWVGSMNIPLSYVNADLLGKSAFTTASFHRNGRKIIPNFNAVFDIEADSNGNLWLATDYGLYHYNPITLEIRGYFKDPDNPNSLSDDFISSMALIGDTALWIGTGSGLTMFDLRTERYYSYFHNDADPASLIDNYAYYLYPDQNGQLWITALNGVSCLDLKNADPSKGREPVFRNLRADSYKGVHTFSEAYSIIRSFKGTYWMGTDNGIFRIDSALNILDNYTVEHGLPNKIANQLLEDSKGHLWISTENGLSWFNPETRMFRNFDVNNGLQSNEFNTTASYADNEGKFYMGGINGFNAFFPDSIKVSDYSPRVVITGLELFNEPVMIDKPVQGFTLTESVYETSEIRLNFRQNFFTLFFASLDYKNPEKILFEYKMEGLDKEWVQVRGTPFAHYTDVKPGKYTFMVRATNSDGIWSSDMAVLKVTVTPPFQKTVFFYILAGLLVAAIVYTVYRYRIISLERDKKLLEEQVMKRTNEIAMMNRELQEHRDNLEAQVNERTTALIAERDRAEKADRIKTAFLSNISHEIRTPMNSIMGFSNLIRAHEYEPGQIEEYLEFITDGAQNLLNIVTNIVEISKISADDLTISVNRFNFTNLMNDLYSRFHAKASVKGIDLILENSSSSNELWIIADEGKISASMNHLLDNAIKFTNEGFVKLSYDMTGETIHVCVQDTGIGVARDIMHDIFESFKQADVTLSRAYGGTGLGLSITKAYIEKMGGRIWLDSVQGRGSSFHISFPCRKCDDKKSSEQKVMSKLKDLCILIVEDEEMNYYYLSEILKNKAKDIFYARDGYSAVEQCRNNPSIGMVLMDIKLPGMNGLEATMEIKKLRPDLPVIAQTAYTLVGDREKALSAGCNDYISKPINREKLYSIIENNIKE